MSDFKAGQEVTVCVQTLYEAGNPLQYGRIEVESDDRGEILNYADLYNEHGELACMDGETCRVAEVKDGSITLTNDYGDSTVSFILTEEEAEVALIKSPSALALLW